MLSIVSHRFLVIYRQDKDSIIKSRYAVFFKDYFPFKQVVSSISGADRRPAQIIESGSEDSVDVEPCRIKRPRKETSFGHDFLTYILESDPTTYQEAMQSPFGMRPLIMRKNLSYPTILGDL